MGIKVYQFDPSVNPAGWPPLGSSGTRMGYTVSSLPGIQGSSHLTVIANGG